MNKLFATITRRDDERDTDFYRRAAEASTGRAPQEAWAGSEIVVTEGYESPYLFGRKLRKLVDDHNATVFRFHTVDGQPRYVAFGPVGAAVYDPTQRAQKPTQPDQIALGGPKAIDYFAAADELSS